MTWMSSVMITQKKHVNRAKNAITLEAQRVCYHFRIGHPIKNKRPEVLGQPRGKEDNILHTLSDTSIPKNTMWNQFGRRFCCYKRVTDTVTGKVRKLPFMPNGRRHASSCDPTTWSSLSDCLAARERQVVDGIGLILPAGYACLDFDNLGTECHPWAERCKALASLSGCHSELSQSRQGWHILGTCNVLSRKRQIPMQLFGALDIIVGNDESPDLLYVTDITPSMEILTHRWEQALRGLP